MITSVQGIKDDYGNTIRSQLGLVLYIMTMIPAIASHLCVHVKNKIVPYPSWVCMCVSWVDETLVETFLSCRVNKYTYGDSTVVGLAHGGISMLYLKHSLRV